MNQIRNAIIRTNAVLFLAIAAFAMPSAADAQEPSGDLKASNVAPYQQRLSPYLDLLRTDNSVLGPYHSFVLPKRQVNQSINKQAAQLGRIQRVIERPAAISRSSSRLQTGRGGTFNNYLHYYQFNAVGKR